MAFIVQILSHYFGGVRPAPVATPPVEVAPVEVLKWQAPQVPQPGSAGYSPAIFQQPIPVDLPVRDLEAPPLPVIVKGDISQVPATVKKTAKAICKRLILPSNINLTSTAQEMRNMAPEVKAYFVLLSEAVDGSMRDTGREMPLSKAEIASLILGHAVSAELAGKAPDASQILLDHFRQEWAGGLASVVATEAKFVGEAYHIMVASQWRHGVDLKFKIPVAAVPDIYTQNFNKLVMSENPDSPFLRRASEQENTEIAKKDLTPLMIGGVSAPDKMESVKTVQDRVYAMFTGSLSPASLQEIRDRSMQLLADAGMRPDEPKLGIFIRHVKPGGNGGTQDASNNMSRQRMLDCLRAAADAGIKNIVFFGDPLQGDWLKGTPWDSTVRGHSDHRVANLTEAWKPSAETSPLHDLGRGLGPRQHLSDAQLFEPPLAGGLNLQGGYAEQLCIYHALHRDAGMVAMIGNRSGAIDGPAFCGVPTIQFLVHDGGSPAPIGRLRMIQAAFPNYGLLQMDRPSRAGRTDTVAAGAFALRANELQDLTARLRQWSGSSASAVSAVAPV